MVKMKGGGEGGGRGGDVKFDLNLIVSQFLCAYSSKHPLFSFLCRAHPIQPNPTPPTLLPRIYNVKTNAKPNNKQKGPPDESLLFSAAR